MTAIFTNCLQLKLQFIIVSKVILLLNSYEYQAKQLSTVIYSINIYNKHCARRKRKQRYLLKHNNYLTVVGKYKHFLIVCSA